MFPGRLKRSLTQILEIARGGTGATTAAAARTSLGAAIAGLITGANLTLNTARLLGRTTVGVGAVEEISVGAGLSLAAGTLSSLNTLAIPVRQTVLSGPVDASGLPNFGGATGATTVTMAGTLIATAANGFGAIGAVDVNGSGTNLAWTGLAINGTMYLYVDVAGGVLTPGAGTLQPNYQWGGAYSGAAGQFTFNIQEMNGKVANVQAARVYVGEVTVAGGVVTAITWYALQGRYESAAVTPVPAVGTPISVNHNLGIMPKTRILEYTNVTTDAGWAVGDSIENEGIIGDSNYGSTPVWAQRTTGGATWSSLGQLIYIKGTGVATSFTKANWSYRFRFYRGW